jgi:hypothetical protein
MARPQCDWHTPCLGLSCCTLLLNATWKIEYAYQDPPQFPASWHHTIKLSVKVRKKRQWDPCLLSHRGWDFKKQGKKKYTGLQLGMKLSLAANLVLNLSLPSPFFSWTPSTNRCCCYVYCSYICFGAWCILSLSISYPYLIKFHYFADNSQEGMKHQIGGATQGQQGMTLQAGKCNVEHSILLPDEVQLNFTAGLTK